MFCYNQKAKQKTLRMDDGFAPRLSSFTLLSLILLSNSAGALPLDPEVCLSPLVSFLAMVAGQGGNPPGEPSQPDLPSAHHG